MHHKAVYYLGNQTYKNDNTVFLFIPLLKKKFPHVKFIHLDPTEEINPFHLKDGFTLIDTVYGIKRVTVFHNLDNFSLSPRVTVHDYDLPIDIGILTKLGKIKKILLIGIPRDKKRVAETEKEVEDILKLICGSS
ncbi:hypothetical protein M1271_02700 [Patescibacteria group bacterium]|nr:hypothetical protein [Patescibacteria group bacterium]MCL5798198.1 hypothetical protein [Patescibacteria group bacterium]